MEKPADQWPKYDLVLIKFWGLKALPPVSESRHSQGMEGWRTVESPFHQLETTLTTSVVY